MKRVLKEPLVHFVLLGAAVFIAYRLLPASASSNEPDKIVVTQGQIENLVAGFSRAWQRPPTEEELAGLIKDRVREEVCYREAIALGLDKDDTIIRRRLRQKLEFVSEDISNVTEPSEADLTVYMQAHPDSFRIPQMFTFRQVYFNPEKHGKTLDRDLAQVLQQLNEADDKADVTGFGDEILLEQQTTAAPAGEIAKQFGEKFVAQLSTLEPGKWHGPVESGYGQHLVFVAERTESRLPALAEVHEAVRREWENARRLDANEKFYESLLKRYTVTVEQFEPAVPSNKLAANAVK